jgi:RHS repeat-associated protein
MRLAPNARTKRPNLRRAQLTPDAAGQTTTLLADGRLLLTGGETEDGPSAGALIRDPRTGNTTPLPLGLAQARAWHSATILPDGRVIVAGGVGADRRVLDIAEIFDPETQTFEQLSKSGLSARAYHTATLLTDGHVLFAGGVSDKGNSSARAELWDFRTNATKKLPGQLSAARQKHRAILMPDGNVLLEGGVDDNRNEIAAAELYNTDSQSFIFTTLSSSTPDDGTTPFLAASIPRDGATDVPANVAVALRFSKQLRAETINSQSVKLVGREGTIAAKIVPAENGRLAFVTSKGSLLSGATYTLTIVGATDGTNELAPSSISFTTKEEKSKNETRSTPPSQPDWLPDSSNVGGNWKTNAAKSPWEDLAPLQATAGETALAGQVLTLTGQPLSDVTLRVGDKSTRTDNSGRFLLGPLSHGRQVLVIDGRSASVGGKVYGTFRAGVEITEKITNVLPFKIWMPRLDMGHAVNIPSPTTEDVVITNPLIPGLELRLPAGTTIRDIDGNAVTQVSITPVPTDRPPFPLPPGFNVPVFASIQPGGARIIPPRAQLIYPNYTNERPGARIDFWNYDPEGKGWYIYGQGTVSANGKQIIPDPGVVIYEFTGIMIGSGGIPPWLWPLLNALAGDPVDLATGLFVLEKTDLALPDTLPLTLTRTYRPLDNASRAFGIGSTHPYEMFLYSVNNYLETDLILPDGGRIHYVRISPGTGWWDAVYEHTGTPGPFYKSRISWNGAGWDLKLRDGTVYVFPDFAPLRYIRDRYGNQITITRSGNNITQITSPNGRTIQFTYDTSNRITQARDNVGRTVNYEYDAGGRLWRVTDPAGGVTEYTYDTSNRMLTIKDARGIVFLTNQYDTNGRVIRQTQADNSTYQFAYTVNGAGKVTQTDVTDPRNQIRRVTFNSDGYPLTDTYALGRPEQQTETYERQAGTNFPLSVIDSLNRRTNYAYDAAGNLTSITELAQTSEAVMTTFTYDPTFHQLLTITDPLNHTVTYGYDTQGNLTSVTNSLGQQAGFTYSSTGLMESMTDQVGNTAHWTYDGGDITSVTDPLGNVSSRYVDIAGRPVRTTDALGRIRTYKHDALNQITQATDPAGGDTFFEYDPNGNLLSVMDPRGNITSFTYDAMDRLATRKDPLLREESYQYDGNGNLIQVTDRRGQVTDLSYDALDRLTLVTYADDSTTSYTYDAGNRVIKAVDSLAGTITYSYDNQDRLLSEITAQGTVTYTYDAADRITSMTVTGQPAVNYGYDAADRLTSITQGQSSIVYTYDSASRRTSVTLPNGVIGEYGYDAGSNVTSITYRQGANVLGNLTYQYDVLGARTKVGGSLARTNFPLPFESATYNAANQLIQRGTTAFTYDNHGNLLTDGANTYSWDARNRLAAITGATEATLQYDASGRRSSKTVNGQSTQYLYDGADVVQELVGGNPTANILNGSRIDEPHQCSCNGANNTLLPDALGNVLALGDALDATQTQYTYDAFGNTTSNGVPSSNNSQYTGRENDGTGLYYYRARYYSPALQRFISEDPIGFDGGDLNLYAYVGNDPINASDPFGTIAPAVGVCIGGALANVAIDAAIGALSGRKVTLGGLGRSALMGCGMALIGLGLGKLLGLGLRIMSRGLQGAARGGNNLAYRSVNAAGEVDYVGITNNIGRRAAEHLRSPRALSVQPVPGLDNLSRADARAVEQVLIETHGLARNGGSLLNRINSIARSNPGYADAIARGAQLLRRAGYPGF